MAQSDAGVNSTAKDSVIEVQVDLVERVMA